MIWVWHKYVERFKLRCLPSKAADTNLEIHLQNKFDLKSSHILKRERERSGYHTTIHLLAYSQGLFRPFFRSLFLYIPSTHNILFTGCRTYVLCAFSASVPYTTTIFLHTLGGRWAALKELWHEYDFFSIVCVLGSWWGGGYGSSESFFKSWHGHF